MKVRFEICAHVETRCNSYKLCGFDYCIYHLPAHVNNKIYELKRGGNINM